MLDCIISHYINYIIWKSAGRLPDAVPWPPGSVGTVGMDVRRKRAWLTCHNLALSEIDGGLFLAVFTGSKGDTYFTELADRAEYGNCAWGTQV